MRQIQLKKILGKLEIFSLPQAIEGYRKFQTVFAPPNRYFTENSRWVPLTKTTGKYIFWKMFCSYKCSFSTKHFPIFLNQNFKNENLRPKLIKVWKGKTKTNEQSHALSISCSNGQFLSGFDLLLQYIAYNLIPQAQYLENTSSHLLQSMSFTG